MKVPSSLVVQVIGASLSLFGKKDLSWKSCKTKVNKILQLKDLVPEDIKEERIVKLKEILSREGMNSERMASVSSLCHKIFLALQAIVEIHDMQNSTPVNQIMVSVS